MEPERRLNGFHGSGVDSAPANPHSEGIAVRGRGFTWCRWEGWDIQRLHQGAAKYAGFLLVGEKEIHQDGASDAPPLPK